MKRYAALLFAALCFALLIGGCGGAAPLPEASGSQSPVLAGQEQQAAGAVIAFITAGEDVDSAKYQQAWGILSRFAGEEGFTSGTYSADVADQGTALSSVELAVKGGAQLIVLQGAALADTAEAAQFMYPTVRFILLEMPEDVQLGGNTAQVRYSAQQGGWLAGYAAVAEEYRQLGYLDVNTPTARLYALGFLLGAEAAAEDLGLEPGEVQARPLLLDIEAPEEEWRGLLEGQLETGEEEEALLVFSNYAAAQSELLAATKSAKGHIIGVGLAMAPAGETALTTVVNQPASVLSTLLAGWKQGSFPGGEVVYGTVSGGDVSLQTEDSHLARLTDARYGALVERFDSAAFTRALAERTAPGDDGALPDAAGLELELVRAAPPALEEDGGGSSSLARWH